MNKKGITFLIALLIGLGGFAAKSFALGVPGVDKDNGTDQEGELIISKTEALRCGLKSSDGSDMNKRVECLNKIASDIYGSQTYKQEITDTRNDVLQGYAKAYLEKANKNKADAGDYVDKGDENGNSELKTDKHGKKEQEGKVSAGNGKNVLAISDVIASSLTLDSMETFFLNIKDRKSVV